MDPKTKEILHRPFEKSLIRERVGPGGRLLSYVPVGHYIARLNEAFDDWSYEIMETKLMDHEVIVHVRLTAGGMTKMGIGGTAITRRRDNGKPVSLAHDVMAAEANSLKRACRLFGIGAALYMDEDDAPVSSNHSTRPQHDRRREQHPNAPDVGPQRTQRHQNPEPDRQHRGAEDGWQNATPANTNALGQESRPDLMTPAQRRLLFRIAAERGVPTDGIQQWLEDRVGLKSLRTLGKREASYLIERLTSNGHAGAAP